MRLAWTATGPTANQRDARKNDGHAADNPQRDRLVVNQPPSQNRHDRIDIGVGSHQGNGDVAQQPIVSHKADEGAEHEEMEKRVNGSRRELLALQLTGFTDQQADQEQAAAADKHLVRGHGEVIGS